MKKILLLTILSGLTMSIIGCNSSQGFKSKPEFLGVDPITLDVGQQFNPLHNVYAFDTIDGDLTEDIQVIGTNQIPVNHHKQITRSGTYTVTYRVTNSQGNRVEIDREITVLGDPMPEYVLVWSDEFDYVGMPDPTKWEHQLGGGGWGNRELQNYTNLPANSWVENGQLRISLIKEPSGYRDYSSARLRTRGLGDWLYGRFEIRAKVPTGLGTWPAIWMMPSHNVYGGWPRSGEIDIMEHVGYDPNVIHGTIHTQMYNGMDGTQIGSKMTIPTATTDFHVYALEWSEKALKFFIDDFMYFEYPFIIDDFNTLDPSEYWKMWPFDQEFHLILNIAMGGNWGGIEGINPNFTYTEMLIDYVRVYQEEIIE